MKLTQYVNAMALLESENSRVLCDPWVTGNSRSRSDFYNFPELKITPEEITAIDPDFIYITHTHSDHFDPDTLKYFPKDTPVIVSWYENNFTERMVREVGFSDVRVSDPENGLPLNGDDHCWINPGTLYPDTDSVAFFRLDGQVVCNFNDNPFEETYVRKVAEKYGPVDIALVPFAGHGPYPMFYDNLTEEEKEAAAKNKRNKYYADFVRFTDILRPRYLVPFAGGVLCGGEKALRYVHSGIGSKSEAIDYARANSPHQFEAVMMSGLCCYDFSTDTLHGEYLDQTHRGEWEYIKRMSKIPKRFDAGGEFYIAPSERIDLTKILKVARNKQKSWQDRKNISSTVSYYFDVGEEELYGLSLATNEVHKVAEKDIDDPFYEIFRLPYGLLVGLLSGHYVWSNVKTQYVNYFRKPDKYEPNLHFLMNFLHV